MTHQKIEYQRCFQASNKGFWLGARIYSDVKNNLCKCGGKFTAKETFHGLDYPVCSDCRLAPPFYRIVARVVDQMGVKIRTSIRHTRDGDRLNDILLCLWVFKGVKKELDSGTFNYLNYDSRSKRDSILLKNVVYSYLEFHRKRFERGDITPSGFNSKLKYSKLVVAEFGEIPIDKINLPMIEAYRNSFTSKFSNRDMSLGELKTILKFALANEIVSKIPLFKVPASSKRKLIPNLKDTKEKVIPAIKDTSKREAIRVLYDYGLRPCEVRAIQYEQIDFKNRRLKIDRHFSGNTLLKGRKSHKEGKCSVLDRPLTKELIDYLNSRPRPIDPKAFVFVTKNQNALSSSALNKAWNQAEAVAGIDHAQLYGIRGARITEVIGKGGISKGKAFAGHSSVITTANRYEHSWDDVDEYVETDA